VSEVNMACKFKILLPSGTGGHKILHEMLKNGKAMPKNVQLCSLKLRWS